MTTERYSEERDLTTEHHLDRPDVFVLGGHLELSREDPRSIPEMVLATVEGALADAGLDWDDIDAVVTSSVDLLDGLTASNIAVTEVVGAVMKPETRIAADGLVAAIHASHQLRAEAYQTVLVVAHGKASMAPYWDLTAWAMDPVFLQPLGVDFLTFAGLQAGLLADADPTAVRRWAEVAQRRSEPGGTVASIEDVLTSANLASPIRAGMAVPLGDGACAVILGTSPSGRPCPRVMGTGQDLAAHGPDGRDLADWTGLGRAMDTALAAADISDPRDAFDVAEPSCLFAHEEELFRAAAGIDESTAISPTGGLFAGTAPVVSGLSRLLAAAKDIESKPGARALAHGTWGPAGQGQAVMILEAT